MRGPPALIRVGGLFLKLLSCCANHYWNAPVRHCFFTLLKMVGQPNFLVKEAQDS